MKKILEVIMKILLFFIIYIGGFFVHIFTCAAVAESYGSFLGIIAFFCPFISTIIMFLLYLIYYGLFNEFCIVILVYIGLVFLVFLFAYFCDFLIKKHSKHWQITNFNDFEKPMNQEKYNTIHKFMNESGLSEKVCIILYDILIIAKFENKEMAMQMIYNILIPQLKSEQIISNVGIAVSTLICDSLLTQDEANRLAYNVIMDMSEKDYKE